MRFPVSCPIHIVMIGCGGTGGHIAPHLYRLLYSVFRPSTVILCDGDLVEKKNLVRQNFVSCDLGRNKAEVLAERYSAASSEWFRRRRSRRKSAMLSRTSAAR